MIVSKKRISAVICVGGVAFAAGCAPEPQADEEPTGVASVQEPLNINDTLIWQATLPIPICWKVGGFATEKGWVRDAVEGSWGTETGATFTGWATCTDSFTTGVRIDLVDERGGTDGLGTELDGDSTGMQLNFTFVDFFPEECGGVHRETCIRNTAIHEFGHLLAFAHEQNRLDAPTSCNEHSGSDGTATYGAWDLESVMSPCSHSWTHGGVLSKLSPTDIAGGSHYYGGSRPMSAAILDSAGNKGAAWRGIDRSVYLAESAPTSSTDTITSLGGSVTSDPAIVASNGRFDVFVRGNDGLVYHKRKQGAATSGWMALGTGIAYSNPTAVRVGDDIHVFIRGMDDALWRGVVNVNGDSFGGWSSLGGSVTGTVSATLTSYTGFPVILHVAVRTLTGTLAHRSLNVATSVWTAWDAPVGTFWGSPSLIASGTHKLDAFVHGKDDKVYRARFDGLWSNFQAVGSGTSYGSPSAVSWGPGRVDVFVRGRDNVIWHAFSNSDAAYVGWDSLGTLATSSPAAVAWGGNSLATFANGIRISPAWSLGATRTTWDGTAWQGASIFVANGQNPRF